RTVCIRYDLFTIYTFTLLAPLVSILFFFIDTATTEIYTLSLHDALPILRISAAAHVRVVGIYARRMNAREHLSGRGLGSGHFLEPQHFRTAELTNENRFHDSSPLGSAANAPKRIHPPS